jgi:hypothetical protein
MTMLSQLKDDIATCKESLHFCLYGLYHHLSTQHFAMAPVGSLPTDDTAVNVTALRSSSAGVRLAAVKALLEDGKLTPLTPFADQILPLVADSDPEETGGRVPKSMQHFFFFRANE